MKAGGMKISSKPNTPKKNDLIAVHTSELLGTKSITEKNTASNM